VRAIAAVCGLALLLLAPACSDEGGARSLGGSSCRSADGAPDPFPIERAELEGEEDRDEDEMFAFPAALMDLDLGDRSLHSVADVVLVDGSERSRWSDSVARTTNVTQTASIVDTPDEQSVEERHWSYEQWHERSNGGEWITHDEVGGYEPPYAFGDNMQMIMPSSMAIRMQDDLVYAGSVEVDGVSYARYCDRSPWVAWSMVGGRSDAELRPTSGAAEFWVHPDGYVAELVARSAFAGGAEGCWAVSLVIDATPPPGLEAPAAEAPLFASRFGSNGCEDAG
jgi:hypothetical protein